MYYLNHHRSLSRYCWLVALCLLFQLSSNAQSLPSDAYVSMSTTTTPGTVNGNYFIQVPDTGNVTQIEIVLGTSLGGNEYLSHVINFDGTGLPSGFSFSRTANMVTIGIGDLTENAAYYGQVRLKDNSGSWSSIYQFVSN